jgi:hypothetical protein
MDVEPKLPGPIYAPELVADAILIASQYPKRDIFVGGAAKFFSSAAHYAPRMMDKFLQNFMFKRQLTARPARAAGEDSLHQSGGTALQERQGQDSHVFMSSVYTRAVTRPKSTAAVLLAAGLVAVVVWQLLRPAGARSR